MGLGLGEELLGLGEAALAASHFSQLCQALFGVLSTGVDELAQCSRELRFGLLPGALPNQDGCVVVTTDREQGRDAGALHKGECLAAPLGRPVVVGNRLAGVNEG